MKVIYIAGKYRDVRGEYYVVQNIRAAEKIALHIWENGAVAICPHANTRLFGGALPDETWLNGDLELIRRSDAVYQMENAHDSAGAKMEIELAKKLGMPVLRGLVNLRNYIFEGET